MTTARPLDPHGESLRRALELPATEQEAAVAQVVADAHGLAVRVASRYTGRGEPFEDLLQVSRLGLLLAARRYDPSRGVPFSAYATATIEGEVKRHFRDHVWHVRPPRALQDLRPRVHAAQEELTQELQRPPSTEELAARLGVAPALVREALQLCTAYRSDSLESLDLHVGRVAETLATPDARLVEVEDVLSVRPVLDALPDRTRRVLRLHYLEEHSQRRVAAQVGVSQVQVGRIVRSAIDELRRTVGPESRVPRAG